MKKSSRRRLLLSSVVMLLVAVFALGTATYAWFSSTTTANASEISVNTTAASNLLIRKGSGGTSSSTDWANSIAFGVNQTLQPVSTSDLTSWFTALAPGLNETGIKAGSVENKSSAKNGYVIEQEFQLYYKAEASASPLNVNWQISVDATETGDDDFLRVAIYDVTDSAIKCVYGNAADGDAVKGVGTDNNGELKGSTNVTTTAASGTLATFSGGDIKTYRVVVWYEGTDPHCVDDNAVTVNGISLTFAKSGT